ncbi:hypothetical protein D3C87_2063360 [compost metagenome]
MLAGEIERFHAVSGLDRFIARRLDQIAEELHVQLVVFDNHDPFGHCDPFLKSRLQKRMFGI